jgi:hypothetical protein
VVFRDPFDGSRVRWNPVARVDVSLSDFGHKLIVGLPGKLTKEREFVEAKPNINGDYPVHLGELAKMVTPCLVKVLDAYYSSLVMERLAERGISSFVGIHDCWLVPEKVEIEGTIRNGSDILEQVKDEVAGEWYKGLGCVYEDLLVYLDRDKEFGPFIRSAQARWRERVEQD